MNAISLAENGYIPTWLVRRGIRSLVRKRLATEIDSYESKKESLVEYLSTSPLAVETDAANEQHYEVPADFYKIALGPRLKYSCCYWPDGVTNLKEAEEASLDQISERAQLADGQSILELGCGWGSFSLYAAERFPNSEIVAVSNSSGQRKYISEEAKNRGLQNLRVITADMNSFQSEERFDRVVSVEMFEHMRNYKELFAKIHTWLNPQAKMFIHVFSHKEIAYLFEDKEADDWMARHFFTGGIMPSHDLLPRFCQPFKLINEWKTNGVHYQKTAEAWFQNLDENKAATRKAMERIYGESEAKVWENRWRIFMLSCAELFGYSEGDEWGVSHYLFEKE